MTLFEAVLSVSVRDCWITALAPRHGVEIRVIDRKPVGPGRMRDLFEARASPEAVPGFLKDVRTYASVRKLNVVDSGPGRVAGIVEATNCDACSDLVRSNCFIAGAICRGGPTLEWNLVFRDVAVLKRLVRRLERRGYEVELVRLAAVKDAIPLTHRQERVLGAALELGYFDYPRRIRLTELASRLRISKSWVSEVLRRAQTKVVSGYFATEPAAGSRRRG